MTVGKGGIYGIFAPYLNVITTVLIFLGRYTPVGICFMPAGFSGFAFQADGAVCADEKLADAKNGLGVISCWPLKC